jgi:hypothetical protein
MDHLNCILKGNSVITLTGTLMLTICLHLMALPVKAQQHEEEIKPGPSPEAKPITLPMPRPEREREIKPRTSPEAKPITLPMPRPKHKGQVQPKPKPTVLPLPLPGPEKPGNQRKFSPEPGTTPLFPEHGNDQEQQKVPSPHQSEQRIPALDGSSTPASTEPGGIEHDDHWDEKQ